MYFIVVCIYIVESTDACHFLTLMVINLYQQLNCLHNIIKLLYNIHILYVYTL